MNTIDIRQMNYDQRIFWLAGGILTAGVVGVTTLLAFYGGMLQDSFLNWRERRRAWRTPVRLPALTSRVPAVHGIAQPSFEVLGAKHTTSGHRFLA